MQDIPFPCVHKLVSGNSYPVCLSVCVCLHDPPASPCLLHTLIQGMLVDLLSSTKHWFLFHFEDLNGHLQEFRSCYTICSVTEHGNKASQTQHICLSISVGSTYHPASPFNDQLCEWVDHIHMAGSMCSSWGSVHTLFPL